MIDESFHIPVLTEEVIEHLIRKKDGHYLDATAGFGGHSSAILECLDNGSLVAIDRDPEAINYLNSKFKSENGLPKSISSSIPDRVGVNTTPA